MYAAALARRIDGLFVLAVVNLCALMSMAWWCLRNVSVTPNNPNVVVVLPRRNRDSGLTKIHWVCTAGGPRGHISADNLHDKFDAHISNLKGTR